MNIATTSCYVDQTQGILNKKHGGKATLLALTTGSNRWKDIVDGRMSKEVDNLLTLDIKTNYSTEEFEKIESETGYQVLTDSELSFFKECKVSDIVKSITLQQCMDQDIKNRIDVEETFHDVNCIYKPEVGQPYILDADGENNNPKTWYRSKNYHRIYLDIKHCNDCKVDWKQLLNSWRAFLSSKYAVSCRSYTQDFYRKNINNDDDDTTVRLLILHVFTVIPATANPNDNNNKLVKIAQTDIWGKDKIGTKQKYKKVLEPDNTVLIYENPELCLQQIFYSLFERVFQENRVKAIDIDTSIKPILNKIINDDDDDEMKDDDDNTTIIRKISLNIQSESSRVLQYIYQFLLRPDILPVTAVLINVEHIYEIYGIMSARNQLVIELKKVLDDLKSPVDRHHIELIADFISFKGILLPLTRASLKIMNTDWVTNTTYQNGLTEFSNGARKSEVSFFI